MGSDRLEIGTQCFLLSLTRFPLPSQCMDWLDGGRPSVAGFQHLLEQLEEQEGEEEHRTMATPGSGADAPPSTRPIAPEDGFQPCANNTSNCNNHCNNDGGDHDGGENAVTTECQATMSASPAQANSSGGYTSSLCSPSSSTTLVNPAKTTATGTPSSALRLPSFPPSPSVPRSPAVPYSPPGGPTRAFSDGQRRASKGSVTAFPSGGVTVGLSGLDPAFLPSPRAKSAKALEFADPNVCLGDQSPRGSVKRSASGQQGKREGSPRGSKFVKSPACGQPALHAAGPSSVPAPASDAFHSPLSRVNVLGASSSNSSDYDSQAYSLGCPSDSSPGDLSARMVWIGAEGMEAWDQGMREGCEEGREGEEGGVDEGDEEGERASVEDEEGAAAAAAAASVAAVAAASVARGDALQRYLEKKKNRT